MTSKRSTITLALLALAWLTASLTPAAATHGGWESVTQTITTCGGFGTNCATTTASGSVNSCTHFASYQDCSITYTLTIDAHGWITPGDASGWVHNCSDFITFGWLALGAERTTECTRTYRLDYGCNFANRFASASFDSDVPALIPADHSYGLANTFGVRIGC